MPPKSPIIIRAGWIASGCHEFGPDPEVSEPRDE